MPWPKGCPSWNAGKRTSDEHRAKISASTKGRVVSDETKKKISIASKASGKAGGPRIGGGKGKKGKYKGIWCDSSWELAMVLYCHLHNKTIIRNTKPRKYMFNGKVKKYYPDFVIDGVVTEIKGWKTEEWLAKELHNPDVQVLSREEMQPILKEVKLHFGEDFVKFYGE